MTNPQIVQIVSKFGAPGLGPPGESQSLPGGSAAGALPTRAADPTWPSPCAPLAAKAPCVAWLWLSPYFEGAYGRLGHFVFAKPWRPSEPPTGAEACENKTFIYFVFVFVVLGLH